MRIAIILAVVVLCSSCVHRRTTKRQTLSKCQTATAEVEEIDSIEAAP